MRQHDPDAFSAEPCYGNVFRRRAGGLLRIFAAVPQGTVVRPILLSEDRSHSSACPVMFYHGSMETGEDNGQKK